MDVIDRLKEMTFAIYEGDKYTQKDDLERQWNSVLENLPCSEFLSTHKNRFLKILERKFRNVLESNHMDSRSDFFFFIRLFNPHIYDTNSETLMNRHAGLIMDMLERFNNPGAEILSGIRTALRTGFADELPRIMDMLQKFLKNASSIKQKETSGRFFDYISEHPGRFRNMLNSYDDIMDLAGYVDIGSKEGNLTDFLYNVPLDLLPDHKDEIMTVLKRNPTEKAAQLFKIMAVINDESLLPLFADHSDKAHESVLKMLDYLSFIKAPIEELLKSGMEITFKDLTTDSRSGSSEPFTDFSLDKKDIYTAFFQAIQKAGVSQYEDELLNNLNFDNFGKEMNRKDLLESIKIIDDVINSISPKLRHKLYERYVVPKIDQWSIANVLWKWYNFNPKTGKVKFDVTQNNISDVNAMLSLFGFLKQYSMHPDVDFEFFLALEQMIPLESRLYISSRGVHISDMIDVVVNKLDAEEINFNRSFNIDDLANFFELQEGLANLSNEAGARYLGNMFGELDLSELVKRGDESLVKIAFDIAGLEKMRQQINQRNKVLGDQFIDQLGTQFLTAYSANDKNLTTLLSFSRAWEMANLNNIEKDVQGLYQQYSMYGFNMIANLLRQEWSACDDSSCKDEFVKKYSEELTTLASRGIEVITESDVDKAWSRLFSNTSYVARRFVQKKLRTDSAVGYDMDDVRLRQSDWPARSGVTVNEVMDGNSEVAKMFKIDKNSGAVKILASRTGLVDTKTAISELGDSYIFSAPMTMTTGVRKMTELVFVDGRQISYLLTPGEKDGMLLVSSSGEPKIIDKRDITIGELLNDNDLKDPTIKEAVRRWRRDSYNSSQDILNAHIKPLQQFADRTLFISILKSKKYSLSCGMLLMNGDEVHKLEDGKTSRRFFAEFNDGSFGIMNSSADMTSADLIELSMKVGVNKAIYMDTGMWDMASYKDGSGEMHIVGHSDSVASTNRVVIYSRQR